MSPSEPQIRVVLVTAPEPETAARIARTLVEERLAACVNVLPGIRSTYRWKSEVQQDDELLLVIKTRADRLVTLTGRVRDLHPYEVPEVIALAVDGGSADYLAWVAAESTP
jgi:periplasmic divalent cation tolerance protein